MCTSPIIPDEPVGKIVMACDNPVETDLKQTIAGIQLGYGIPSFLLMLIMFVHLAKSKKYKNSFYRLVQVDLVVNMSCWLNTWIGLRALDHEAGVNFVKWLENRVNGTFGVSQFFIYFFFHMQFSSAAILSVHRFSSIKFFTKYERFWSKYYPLVTLLLIIYSSLPQIGGPPVTMEIRNDTIFITTDVEKYIFNAGELFLFAIIYFIALVALGITVARSAFKALQETSSGNQEVSRKLTKIALTYALVYSGLLLWTILNMSIIALQFLPVLVLETLMTMLGLASDMMTLSLPYILLIFDTNIKRDFRISKETANVVPAVASFSL